MAIPYSGLALSVLGGLMLITSAMLMNPDLTVLSVAIAAIGVGTIIWYVNTSAVKKESYKINLN